MQTYKIQKDSVRVSAIPKTLLALTLCWAGSTVYAADAPSADSGHAAAPTANTTPAVQGNGAKNGELDVSIKGTRKEQIQVGKLDPPAAFNLEDIQNFPEDRLQPVLNNPLTFEEGRDFSSMMDFQSDQLAHPWLAELSKAPYLVMKTAIDKPSKDWTFSIIDQAGNAVTKQEGHGLPPALISWDGSDNVREHVAVDTVYIPQLATTDKEGYHHTYTGEPAQFSSLTYTKDGKIIVELSCKRIFQEKKTDFTKEAYVLLDKVCDVIREDGHLPFAIQPYDVDADMARARQQALTKYFADKLFIPESQIVSLAPLPSDKRGVAMAILANSGGSN